METHTHQIFAIARIRPRGYPEKEMRYRCVAALHHERCYGLYAVNAMQRCLRLVKQRENAEIVRAELQSIDGQYGQWRVGPRIPDVPCPYTAFLLGTAYTTDLSTPGRPYGSHARLLSANMSSSEADSNDDGISVVDVTDPSNPTYCFVSIGGLSTVYQPPELHPISAAQYLQSYHPVPGSGGPEVETVLALLQEYKLINRQVLFESWPAEYGSEIFRLDVDTPKGEPDRRLPSLVNLALGPAMAYAVETDDFSDIAGLLILPGIADVVRNYLKNVRPIPESALPLLMHVLPKDDVEEGHLDLSNFSLSTEQILSVTEQSGQSVESLNLSFNPNISESTIRDVVIATPRLRRLVLMGCPGLSDEHLLQFFRQERHLLANMDALIHPLVLSFDGLPVSCLSIVIMTQSHGVAGATLPFGTPRRIVQNLIDYLKIFLSGCPSVFETASRMPWLVQSAFAAAARRKGQAWAERSVVCIPAFSRVAREGEGWIFLIRDGGQLPQPRRTWGFLRLDAPSRDAATVGHRTSDGTTGTWKIHSLHSFLESVSEGQEKAPEDAVKDLEEVINRLHREQNMQMMDSWLDRHLLRTLRR